jgi:uncharacterized glyoxalase superfamily protein PhnB
MRVNFAGLCSSTYRTSLKWLLARTSTALNCEQMLNNRSVPVNTLLPHIVYRDVVEAVAWLTKTFGFREHYRYGAPDDVSGAQMHLGAVYIMLRQSRAGEATPKQIGHSTQSLTVFVEDIDQHYRRTKAAGARIVEELHITEYGEHQYGAEDLDGHHWLFSRHARDVSPEEWGAQVPPSARSNRGTDNL